MKRPLDTLLLKCKVRSQVSNCCGQGLGSDPCLNRPHPNDAAISQTVQNHTLKA